MTDVKFTSCFSSESLISGFNKTTLHLDNVTFSSNQGPLVSVENRSSLFINNSVFVHNKNYHLSLLKSIGGLVLISNSNFSNNVIPRGALIALISKTIASIDSSQFLHNTVRNGFGNVYTTNSDFVNIKGSTFSNNKGGAIAVYNSTIIVISNSQFLHNTAEFGPCLFFQHSGGYKIDHIHAIDTFVECPVGCVPNSSFGRMLHLGNHTVNIFNSTFSENTGLKDGGAIFGFGASVQLCSCGFTKNDAMTQHPGSGGAIRIRNQEDSLLVISNSSFHSNRASGVGGAVFTNTNTIILDSMFSGNSAGVGGAIVCSSGTIANTTFESNTADLTGGALNLESDTRISISITKFSHNTAAVGGAICGVSNTSLSCIQCSFHNNTAGIR